MNIFLFDMDGVLLESQGYHLALQDTVRRMANALGFGDATLSPDDIAAFEAGGITSEWDEAAISTAVLLETAWKDEPELDIPDSLTQAYLNPQSQTLAPNFQEIIQKLSTPDMFRLHPLERAERLFLNSNQHTTSQRQVLRNLVLGARVAELSITHRTFQELVLGSAEFARLYDLPAVLDCKSYLLQYDHPNISSANITRLKEWVSEPNHAIAVITSRPSLPPAGVFSTPEAEIGAKLVGLEGIPILGWGGMCWLGIQRHNDPQTFLKPSPVHALASLRLTLGETQETSLLAAADLVEYGQAGTGWTDLANAQVTVFEDTPGGIKSLRTARQKLRGIGINIETNYIGIAEESVKIRSLNVNMAKVFSTLNQALDKVMD